MSHSDEEQLLRYADGESPARAAVRVRSHLEACWECRAALEEQQNTVGECVRYRKNVLQRHLPPPPAPWADIYRGFAEIDAALDQAGFWMRAARVLQAPLRNVNKWAPVTVVLLLICLVSYRFRQTPSVQAAELLRKAIAAADARPPKPGKIRIRTRDRQITLLPGAQNSLQTLFQAAHYDWADPLSAKSFQAWRDQLADKRDEVIEGPDAYRIRTQARSGELIAATLTIRRQDLRPVEERFEFSNREWVEIAEWTEEAMPEAIAAAKAPRPAPSTFSTMGATMGDELRVLAALNRVGADLGDPIEVSRAGHDVLVTGVGIAPQRQQEIHDALSSQQHVVVRFSESAPDSPKRERGEAVPDNPKRERADQARLADQIGRVYFAQLAAQVLDLSEPMMSRAYALRRLAERFPIGIESELNAQDWQLLRNLRREHTEALRLQIAEIDRLVRPALAPVSGAARAEPVVVSSSTEDLFQSARQVEKMLAVLFGASVGEAADETLPSQLLSSLAQLRAVVDSYAQAPERRIK
jgi:hypothetical protein